MPPSLLVLLAIWGGLVLFALVFCAGSLSLAPLAGVFLQKAVFGSGPRLVSFHVRGTQVEIRAFPLVAYIVPLGAGAEPPPDVEAPSPEQAGLTWSAASPLRRLAAFVIAPRLVVLALAALLAGPARTVQGLAHAPGELVLGMLAPFTVARALLDRAAHVYVNEGLAMLLGLVLGRELVLGALLLPVDILWGSQRAPAPGLDKARALLSLLAFPLYVSWLLAWASWAVRG